MPPKSATKSPKPAVVSPPAGGNAGRSDERSMSQEAELEQRVAAAVNEHLARLQLGQQVPAAALQPAAVAHIAVKNNNNYYYFIANYNTIHCLTIHQ